MEPGQNLNFKKLVTLLVAGVFLMLFWTYLSSPMVVTVTGTGEVSVPATNATLSFSLTSTESTPQAAINAVNTKAASLGQLLKNMGIAEEDIAESQVTTVPASVVTAGASGYQAVISMGAKTTHVSKVSDLVSNLYSAGAYVVSQPVLSVKKEDELEQKALDAAMKDAKRQAGKMALKNWKLIKKIISITQVSSPTTSTATTKADVLTESQEASQNGVFKIVKVVSVSYKMW